MDYDFKEQDHMKKVITRSHTVFLLSKDIINHTIYCTNIILSPFSVNYLHTV